MYDVRNIDVLMTKGAAKTNYGSNRASLHKDSYCPLNQGQPWT